MAAFTLIELLVVIAIIAILAAILLPVFATLKENARESNTMAHMHDIQSGLALYKLDNKSYPPVLFAYACDANSPVDTTGGAACNQADTMATIASDGNAKSELVGLYPEYVTDWHTFTCVNDPVNDAQGANHTCNAAGANCVSQYPQPAYLQTDGTLALGNGAKGSDNVTPTPYRSYYTADAMDLNPQTLGVNRLSTGGSPSAANDYDYVIRYRTSWTSFDSAYDVSKNAASNNGSDAGGENAPSVFYDNYQRQLMWANPPADTLVTAVTDHVINSNRIIALYVSGAAVKHNLELGSEPAYTAAVGSDTLPWNDGVNPNATLATVGTGCSASTGTAAPASACNYVNALFWIYDPTQRSS